MKLFKRQRREPTSKRSKASRRRRMRVESLENRRVLAANFVTVEIVGDTIELTGDSNANEIEIWQDSRRAFSPSESFTIKAKEGSETLFSFSGGIVGDTYQTPISGAIHNIRVNFGDSVTLSLMGNPAIPQGGADIVEFVGLDQSETEESFLDGQLQILTNGEAVVSLTDLEVDSLIVSHQDDDDIGTTVLDNVVVQDDTVAVDGMRSFFSAHIESGGGGSDITIVDSNLKGGLSISNDGLFDFGAMIHTPNPTGAADIIKISNTDIGAHLVALPQNVLEIYNGDGGSRTTLERDNATDPSRIRGNVVINNEDGFDEVNFSAINIYGGSSIENGAGDFLHGSSIMIHNDSIIGSDILGGGRLDVTNAAGDDRLTIEESRLPSGIVVNNGMDHDTNTIVIGKAGVGGETAARTVIGGNTLTGSAIQFSNGAGNERMSFINADLKGLVDIGLGDGDDIVNMTDVLVDGVLNIGNTVGIRPAMVDALFGGLGLASLADDANAGGGDDRVTLEDVMVTAGTFIGLGDDQDRVDLIDDIDFGPRASIDGGNDAGDTLDRSQLSSVMTNVDFNGFLNHIN
ncbi:Planctomycete extracellular domain protein [Rhodopirellula sp. SWK7]|uniref:Planctomycete extracellular domain protein n=1 Tax=Rhodopirellula sp. SWK7 TaxID=595460 RepID=UPI000348F00A|nr:Planctomycete extracellular domain protein [Rhodopirellula sp. SWK7]